MIAVQIGVILFLLFILIVIYQDEYKKRRLTKKTAKLDSFWDKNAERRKTPRIDAEVEVLYEVVSDNTNPKRKVVSKNISLGGINLALNEKLFPGTVLDIQLNLPRNQQSICMQGEIVWLNEIPGSLDEKQEKLFSAGIKFTKMDPQDEATLNSFINRRREQNNAV